MSEVGRRLDQAPVTPFHRRVAFAIGAGLFVDGIDIYLTSGIAGALVKQGFATLKDVGHLAIATALGLALGGLASGILADRIGRRRTMQWTICLVAVGGIGAALAPSVTPLIAWRFATALALGGETVLAYGTLSEFMPPAVRGRWLAYLGLIANLGNPACLLLGYFWLPHTNGWRWLIALPAGAAVLVFMLRRALPESPRWLESRGRNAEADAIADRLVPLLPPEAAVLVPASSAGGTEANARLAPRLTVGIAINIAIMSAIFGFVTWLPTFFVASGRDLPSSVLFAGVMSLGGPVGTAIGMFITDRIERRSGVIVTSLLAALLGALYAYMHESQAILIVGLCLVTTIYVFGTLGLVGYVPELFPTRIRMRFIGFCATAGRLVVIMLPLLIVPLFQTAGQAGVIAMISGILVIAALLVARWGIATRGRSLESLV